MEVLQTDNKVHAHSREVKCVLIMMIQTSWLLILPILQSVGL